MRLSDAIAVGRVLVKPHARDEWFVDGSGCARGMALEAVGRRESCHGFELKNSDAFHATWPWASTADINGWPCGCDANRAPNTASAPYGFIAHCFDEHVMGDGTWTLDRLIDQIRQLEELHDPAVIAARESASAESAGSQVNCEVIS